MPYTLSPNYLRDAASAEREPPPALGKPALGQGPVLRRARGWGAGWALVHLSLRELARSGNWGLSGLHPGQRKQLALGSAGA